MPIESYPFDAGMAIGQFPSGLRKSRKILDKNLQFSHSFGTSKSTIRQIYSVIDIPKESNRNICHIDDSICFGKVLPVVLMKCENFI